ncbi:MAG: MBL fold metallo-hydrolase [Clostridia bacterium]|nr:MBL fold metallo-hydrolase [Clostridia bacterium]
MSKKTASKLFGLVALFVGLVGGFAGFTYFTLPETDEVHVGEVYYSYGDNENSKIDLSADDAEVSVHFLELGNKYTGDCTYIKTDTCDILIDCGSKTNSIATVSNYLDQYVTDGTLEYVIVTHAHMDHYAGFATSTKVESIFDLYECETIIDFAGVTTDKVGTKTYNNYLRERDAEVANGAKHFTALECINGTTNTTGTAQREFEVGTNVTLEILNSYFYANVDTRDENNNSVCAMIKHGDKNFLFTGDLEAEGEEHLLSLNNLPQVDLYKAGHHGSKTSSSQALLEVINPKTICVCCCAGSPEYTDTQENQFPTQQFISNIVAFTDCTEVYVTTMCIDYKNNKFTSMNGNIVYLSSAEGYNVVCSNNDTILKETEWFKQNRVWEAA